MNRHYVIGFEHNGHSHIIAWDDDHRFDAGMALGKMLQVPEFDFDQAQAWQVAMGMRDMQQQGSEIE